jgi:DNA-binding transcriptional ArsR family regulator
MEEPWEDSSDYVDGRVARAMAHPLRVQILAELNKRVMSPSQFAKKFELATPNVSYHFRALEKLDCIEEVEIRPVRGSIEHFFKATKRALFDGKPWDELPASLKESVSGRAFTDFLEAVAMAMLGETFDARDERMLVWLQQPLDRKGWREAVKAHRDLVRKMDGIFKGSKLRLAEGKDPKSRMLGTYGVFLFESPPRRSGGEARRQAD